MPNPSVFYLTIHFIKNTILIQDENNNLYKQYNLLTRKNQFSNAILDVKEERTSINLNQNFVNISQGL